MTKIIIVDDDLSSRESIKSLVENDEFGKIIAEARNGAELLDLLKIFEPDFILTIVGKPSELEFNKKHIAIIDLPNLSETHLALPDDNWYSPQNIKFEHAALVDITSGRIEFKKAFRAILNGEAVH